MKNCLILNPSKSKFLILGTKNQQSVVLSQFPMVAIKGEPVELVSEARNLGLTFDSELRFESYVLGLVKNCMYRLKVLYRIRPFISTDVRIMLCESLILSKLNYGLTVYGPCLFKKSFALIQRIQNACARYCFVIPPRTHVTPFLNKSNLLKIQSRLKLFCASQLHDVIYTKQPDYLFNKIPWRHSKDRIRFASIVMIAPMHRTAAFRGCFRFWAAKIWNDIPPPLRTIRSKWSFKRKYREYLLFEQKSAPI